MLKLKTPPAATETGTNRKIQRGQNSKHFLDSLQAHCRQCAFFELITRKSGYKYGLCHFTGSHDPQPGQDGCRFIAGNWSRIDEILGLTGKPDKGKVDFPNLTRPCSGLDHSQNGQKVARHSTAIHAHADISGNRALHIGRAQRPHDREAAAASLRPGSVGALPFCFNHPELNEVPHV